MRSLQSWAQQIWQVYARTVRAERSQNSRLQTAWYNLPLRNHDLTGGLAPQTHGQPRGKSPAPNPKHKGKQPALILTLAVFSLTSALGHRFYNQPLLDVGKVALQTISAPLDASVENIKATKEKRTQARNIVLAVLKINDKVNDQVQQEVQVRLDRGSELRQLAGDFPFVERSVLALTSQHLLRQATVAEWQAITSIIKSPASNIKAKPSKRTKVAPIDRKTWQQQVITELLAYRRTTTPVEFAALLNKIVNAQQQYESALKTLADPTIAQSNYPFDATLLALPESVWQQTQAKLPQVATRILAQGIAVGLPNSVLERAVNLQVQADIPPLAQPLAAKVLLASLHPNLIRDEDQSQLKADQAAQEVSPVMITVKQGEAIVQAGKIISPDAFILLDHFDLSRRGTNWLGLLGFGGLVSGAVSIFWWVERRTQPGLRDRDYGLVWLLPLTTPLLITLGVPSTNLPAIGILTGSFYGSRLAVTLVVLLSALLPVGTLLSLTNWLPSAAGGLLAALLAGRLRTREELALLGVGIGLTQGILYFVLGVASGTVWYTLLGATAVHALLGLAWSVVAIGVSPYLEHVFDLVTTVRLVELANPNRPLLKRLAADTPGTFQHTLFVATLAEAAARELGCNVELVRTGTLYHDIGKMHDPLGFIENQMGEPNKHDVINDPWKSAAIIRKHVTEGIVMARKARLPKAVQAFIPEHQGSMLIAYFYHQAQQRVAQDPTLSLNDADFRYDGPAPQSRETGIVMLADSCEAALRSLKEATPEQALNMINKILKARWKDGQLEATGLKREEMPIIARIFVQVWQQSNHQRIAYPSLGVGKSAS